MKFLQFVDNDVQRNVEEAQPKTAVVFKRVAILPCNAPMPLSNHNQVN